MIKKVGVYFLSFLVLAVVTYYSQKIIIESFSIKLRYSILNINVFFSSISFLICSFLAITSSYKKAKDQLGFIYLYTLVFKIILFVLIFSKSILKLPTITKTESLNILIILLIFMFLEVYFTVKLINQK